MVISVAEYKGRFVKTKTVILEEGVEFEIRRVSPIDMWDDTSDIKKEQSPMLMMKKTVIKGTVNPPISEDGKDGKLKINDLSIEHLMKLSTEITDFSGYTDKGEVKSFLSRNEKESTLTP